MSTNRSAASTQAAAVEQRFDMRLTPHEHREIDRLAQTLGTTRKAAVLAAVHRELAELDAEGGLGGGVGPAV